MTDLPDFLKKPTYQVIPVVTSIFTGGTFVNLQRFPDGHFRVTFKPTFFELADGATEPSKSQWSTLKKKFKRRDRQIFIFKDYGRADCNDVASSSEELCYYLDFGYFAYD